MNFPIDDVSAAVARKWWVVVLFGVISIVFGLMAVVAPASTAVAMAWAVGVMAIAEGIVGVIGLFSKDSAGSRGLLFVYALVSLVFGVLAVLNPGLTAAVLVIMLAAWLFVAGIFRIVLAIRIRKLIEGEWLMILSGALAILLGVLFVLYPGAGLVTVALWIGVIALVYGVLQLWAGFKLRKLVPRAA